MRVRGHSSVTAPSGSGAALLRRPWVAKIGGRLVEDEAVRARFAEACAALGRPLVVVHGGGCVITELMEALGIEAKFHEGRRITGARDVEVVDMALSGAVNKALVRALGKAGVKAVGLSGCDAGQVVCDLVAELGAVGVPATVDVSTLNLLLAAGLVPVISPVSLGPDGEPVNVNADEMASALAEALRAERLLLLSDVSGVRVEGANKQEIEATEVESLIAAGEVTGGMVPKLRSAAEAVSSGVGAVVIGGFATGSLAEVGGTYVVAGGSARSHRSAGSPLAGASGTSVWQPDRSRDASA